MWDGWGEEAVCRVVAQAGWTQEKANSRGHEGCAKNGWVRAATKFWFIFSGQQKIFTESKWKSLVSNSDTVDNLPQLVRRKVAQKMRYMGNTDLHIKRGKDVGDTSQLLQQPPYEYIGLSYYWLYLLLQKMVCPRAGSAYLW